jgi:hypothetical protein
MLHEENKKRKMLTDKEENAPKTARSLHMRVVLTGLQSINRPFCG